jgi:hypothetical protein
VEKHADPGRVETTDLSIEHLAACQSVRPIADFDALLGRQSYGDESADEFGTRLRSWRSEGDRDERPR